MNPSDIIQQYIQCRDWLDAEAKKQTEREKPVRERMVLLEAAMTDQLNKITGESDGNKSIKCEAGTAFRQQWTAAKVADRETFMDFVFDGRREGFLTAHVSKDAVVEYMEAHNGSLPPGIDFTSGYKTVFRRAG